MLKNRVRSKDSYNNSSNSSSMRRHIHLKGTQVKDKLRHFVALYSRIWLSRQKIVIFGCSPAKMTTSSCIIILVVHIVAKEGANPLGGTLVTVKLANIVLGSIKLKPRLKLSIINRAVQKVNKYSLLPVP